MKSDLWLRFKRFVLPYPLAWMGKWGFHALLYTCKIEVQGLQHLQQLSGKGTILMLWHNRMAMMCEFFARYLPKTDFAAFISQSRDGEPIAKVVESYRQGSCIRVPHNMKHQALRNTVDYLEKKKGVLLMTPDGPKGPRYKVKQGIVFAGKEAKAPIVPITWEGSSYWEFKSWDGFRLPKPFSRIKITVGAPVLLDEKVANAESAVVLENALNSLGEICTEEGSNL